MSKKKKQTSAQDLIDSLLDDPGETTSFSKQRPKAPPLPEKLFDKSARPLPDSPFSTGVISDELTIDPETARKMNKKSLNREPTSAPKDPGAKTSHIGPVSHPKDGKAKGLNGPIELSVSFGGETSDPMRPQRLTGEMTGEHTADGAPSLPSIASSSAPTLVHAVVENVKGGGAKSPPSSFLHDTDSENSAVDKTMRLRRDEILNQPPIVDRKTATEIRFGIGKMNADRKPGTASSAALTSAEASLKQSESLRIAQLRINALEQELERVRRENEKLASAGETIRRRSDELLSRVDNAESQGREAKRIFDEERKVFRGQLTAKERELNEARTKMEELENRLEANFKKIRVRERELEHRLEIVKMENATLISTKDEMIMRLKREVDQLKFETDSGKQRSQELFNQYKEKQETIRRVVRALRIALTILEGDEEAPPVKKAE